MNEHDPTRPSLDQLVLRWIEILPASNAGVREAFATFVRKSPRHLSVYLRHKVLHTELRALDPERSIDVSKFVARARKRGNVIPWSGPYSGAPGFEPADAHNNAPRGRQALILALAFAMICIALGPLFMQWRSIRHTVYVTLVGQRRVIDLPDGSTMQLNTNSRAEVAFSAGRREVTLIGGEGLFRVHHDRTRPFRVHVGDTVLQDLGTQFNVRIQAEGTRVSVTEGQVLVTRMKEVRTRISRIGSVRFIEPTVVDSVHDPLALDELHEVVIPPLGEPPSAPVVQSLTRQQIADRISWTLGVVTFSGQTLAQAVTEMNRYNTVHLEVADPKVAKLQLGGTFDSTDPLAFAAALARFGVNSDVSEVLASRSGVIHLMGASPRHSTVWREHRYCSQRQSMTISLSNMCAAQEH